MSRHKWNTGVWGLSVVATSLAVEQGIAKKGQRGILLGASGELWKVVKENTTTSGMYAKMFWELAALAEEEEA